MGDKIRLRPVHIIKEYKTLALREMNIIYLQIIYTHLIYLFYFLLQTI